MTGAAGRGSVHSAEGEADAILGRYRLRYRVAQGGMASVYLAQLSGSEDFRKWVAIKTVHPHIAASRKFIQMFLNEARLAARLDHPNICTVFDFGESNGTYYLAMEYLHGESLNTVVRRAWREVGMPLELAARMIADAARGLHAAHELKMDDGRPAGVVHRDVSPQNIFVLYSGITKVVDFGIARSEDMAGERTATGELKGKVAYLAPEQLKRAGVDRRADVWALGVVLWEITLGQRLFKRDTEVVTMMAVATEPVPLPSTAMPEYPRALENIVMRALERDTSRRYQTALEMARDLEAYLASTGRPTGPDAVSDFMGTLFAEQIAARDQLLRRGATSPGVEVHETPSDTSLSRLGERAIADEADQPTTIELVSRARAQRPGATASLPPGPGPQGYTPGGTPAPWPANTNPSALTTPGATPNTSAHQPAPAPAPAQPAARSGRTVILGLLAVLLMTAGVATGVWISQPKPTAPHPGASPPGAATAANASPNASPSANAGVGATPPGIANANPNANNIAAASANSGAGTDAGASATNAAPSTNGANSASASNTASANNASAGSTASASNASAPRVNGTHANDAAPSAHSVRRGAGSTGSDTAAAAPTALPAGPSEVAPPTAGSTRPGFLNLSSSFPAQVFDGSRALGSTPIIDRALAPGHHTLRLVPSDGSGARMVSVDIQSGATSVVRMRLE